jgi:hypothetical protein
MQKHYKDCSVKDALWYSLNSDLLADEMRAEMKARKTRHTPRVWNVVKYVVQVISITALVWAFVVLYMTVFID